MDALAYARQLKQLLPSGPLWNLDPGSWLSKLLTAIGDELARVDGRADQLLKEWDPRTADETLPEWERVLGVEPDTGALTSTRQAAVTRRVLAQGGQTAAYYVAVAAVLGYSVTITEPAVHTWRVTADVGGVSTSYFRAGAARAGDRVLSFVGADVLEDFFNEIKPAHTIVQFVYV